MSIRSNEAIKEIADSPVFIIGVPRSGTSWLQHLLLSHANVCGGAESHFFVTFSQVMAAFDPPPPGSGLVGLAAYWTKDAFWEELRGLWRRAMSPIIEAKPAATILLEKTPHHARHMVRILELFPNARFIHMVRDSRAVVTSLIAASREQWAKHWAPGSVLAASREWKYTVVYVNRLLASLPADRHTTVHYEQLHAQSTDEIIRVFKFVGLNVTQEDAEKMAAEHDFSRQKEKKTAAIPKPSLPSGARPALHGVVYRKGTPDSWREDLSYWKQLVVWAHTRKVMKEMGYCRQGWKVQPDSGPTNLFAKDGAQAASHPDHPAAANI